MAICFTGRMDRDQVFGWLTSHAPQCIKCKGGIFGDRGVCYVRSAARLGLGGEQRGPRSIRPWALLPSGKYVSAERGGSWQFMRILVLIAFQS